ncbi:MAG: thiamine-phosphate kinase [Chloroflexi bacterium]|nr:thiamine-phosphate kinase [Chloroflexota bacterium]
MNVSGIGEQRLITRLAEVLAEYGPPHLRGVWVGIGDDAAVVQTGSDVLLLKTDQQVEGVHFKRSWASASDIGWKALAVNLSDVAAMGGTPSAALVSLALPTDTKIAWVEELYRGLAQAASLYGVSFVGGDTSAAPIVVVTVSLVGLAPLDAAGNPTPLLRSAGRAGDTVVVTGEFGAAAAALSCFEHQRVVPEPSLQKALLRPTPRLREGAQLVEAGVRAAIDVSDGLVADLQRLCVASGVAAVIDAPLIPIHQAEALKFALTGGEDYELLFTAPQSIIELVGAAAGTRITSIGHLVSGDAGAVTVRGSDGNVLDLPTPGWRHF